MGDTSGALPWGDIYFLVNNTCGRFICHTPNMYPPDLSDTNNDLYSKLLTFTVEACGCDPLVTPGDPSKSAIIKLVKKECGAFVMPQDCVTTEPTCIPQMDVDSLSTWITAGAPGPVPK